MSHRLYRVLLLTLSRGFRDEYGREMLQAFADTRGSIVTDGASVIALSLRLRLDQLRMDVRHAVRGLWRQKTFTLTRSPRWPLRLVPPPRCSR